MYSEPGRGTTFKVYLPRTDEAPAPPKVPTHEPPATGTGTILLTEDDAAVRAVVVRILERAGYKVIEAVDAESACAAAASHSGRLDLLLTDVVLPDLSGPELAAVLSGVRPGLEVLYMSGYTDDSIVHHGFLEGGSPFLEKPFQPRDLLRKIREVLPDQADAPA